MNDQIDLLQRTMRTRALTRISDARDGRAARNGKRYSAAREADLLAYAATLPDEEILEWRNTGPGILGWIRTHQPVPTVVGSTTFAEVIKRTGWRVELFWNGSGGWFTARLISPWDRDGIASYPGGFLAPFDNPIGASGSTPAEALANLSEAVLEWA
jgi:hypothetical protein